MHRTKSLKPALFWMTGWLVLMLVMAIAGREATRELSVFQVMLLRSVLGLFMLYPLVRAHGGLPAMQTRQLGKHAVRNAVHYAGQAGWIAALALIPLAQLVAMEFTMPLWTVLLAALVLGERLTRPKLWAVVLGLLGVGLIVRPSASGLNSGQLIALASACAFAVSVILVKSLTRTEGVVVIIFWMLVMQSLLGLVPALLSWRWPTPAVWAWVVVVAFCGTFSHYCMTNALNHADATLVVPMDFLRVPLTAVMAWFIYAEVLDLLMVVGTALILAANWMNLRSQVKPAV
jgi:drug/metabolite transporter (DMT)-like permease